MVQLSTWNADLRLAIGASNGPACKTYCPNGTLGYDLKDLQKNWGLPLFFCHEKIGNLNIYGKTHRTIIIGKVFPEKTIWVLFRL